MPVIVPGIDNPFGFGHLKMAARRNTPGILGTSHL